MNITIQKGNDYEYGFGSHLLSIVSGILYAKENNLTYLHSDFDQYIFINPENEEVKIANELISSIISNLGYRKITEQDEYTAYTFLLREISANVEKYYSDENLKFISSGYNKEKPSFYKDGELNIAVHVRRGTDIVRIEDIQQRYVESSIYDDHIKLLLEKYPDAKIHIFSWTDPGLTIQSDRIIYHTSYVYSQFIEHFNALVHADILLVGSSTFSVSAGLFNKNIVISSQKIMRLPEFLQKIPNQWTEKFFNIFPE